MTIPTRPRKALLPVWLIVALLAAALLGVVQLFRGPADDPDPAYQRPGILDLGPLPEPAPPVTARLPAPERPTVVFFERSGRLPELCAALPGTGLTAKAALAVVTAGAGSDCAGVPVVPDPGGRLAAGYGLQVPNDGGYPVGYALVDADGQIRYRTLAPDLSELYEVSVMLGAL